MIGASCRGIHRVWDIRVRASAIEPLVRHGTIADRSARLSLVHPNVSVTLMVHAPTLYVHLADDGGLLAIDGETGRSAWVTEAELTQRLAIVAERDGGVLVSRDSNSMSMPSAMRIIENSGLPVVHSPEVHPDAQRVGGATSLMSAAYGGALHLIDDLLRRGADISAVDSDGFTALMYAANGGMSEAIRLLVTAEANVNDTSRDGSTALMFASQRGELDAVKQLLAAGASPAACRPSDGWTARDFALANGHDRVAAVLLSVEHQQK